VAMNPLEKLDHPGIVQCLLKGVAERSTIVSGGEAEDAVVERLAVTASDRTELCCRVFRGLPEEPHILFFPGEYDTEAGIFDLAGQLGRFGMTVITADYRGCGGSGGAACISACPGDADDILRAVSEWISAQGRTGPLVIMGRSFGSGIALDLASRHCEETLCLILESAFDRTADFLAGKGIEAIEIGGPDEDPFANRTKMAGYTKPVLFLHSFRDSVVSLTQVEWVVAESRSKATQFQIVPSVSREDLVRAAGDLYYTTIRDFIHLRMGRRPKRRPRAR